MTLRSACSRRDKLEVDDGRNTLSRGDAFSTNAPGGFSVWPLLLGRAVQEDRLVDNDNGQ